MADTDSTPSTPAETDCLVCGSGKSTPKNEILFCDGPNCDIPVHQKCYGVPVVPEGNWYCQRCEDRVSAQNTPACCCPAKTGAFKRTNIPNQYIHVACARFQPTLDATKDPIIFDSSLARKQPCSLCGSDYGIVAGCHETGCSSVMHVTCALNASLMTKSTKRSEIYCQTHRDASILNKVMRATGSSNQHRTGADSDDSRRGSVKRSSSTSHGKSPFPARSSKRARYYGESSDSNEDSEDESDADHDHEEEDEEMEEDEEEELERGGNNNSNSSTRRSPNSNALSRGGVQPATNNNAAAANTSSTGARKLKRPGISRSKSRRSESDSDAAVGGEDDDDDDDGAALGSSSSSSSHSVSPQRKNQPRAENPENSTRLRLLQQLAQKKKSGASGAGSGGSAASSSSFGSGPGGLAGMNIRTLGNAGPPPRSPTTITGAKPGSTQYTNSNQGSPLLGSTERFPNTENRRASALPPSLSGYSNPGSPVQPRFQHERSSPKMGTLQAFGPPSSSSTATVPTHAKQSSSLGSQGSFTASAEQTNGHHSHHHHHHQQQQHPHHQHQHHHHAQHSSTSDEAAKNAVLRQNLIQIFQFLQIAVPAPASSSSPTTGTSTNGTQQNGTAMDGTGFGGSMIEFQPDRLDSYVQALRDSILGPDDNKGKHPSQTPSAVMNKQAEMTIDAKKRNIIIDRVLREVGI
ncbi:nuA3 HAT complex component nto1 [Actinomortierella ambigua]|nr:nuA3 HAT complex component nto1 [Actinomortierella ambigua]